MRAPYKIVSLKNREGKSYFQARFLAEDGTVLRSKSFPQAKSKTQAVRLAEKELKKGIVRRDDNPPALDYCREFWSDNSPYFRSRRLKGKPLSESYRKSGHYNLKHFEPCLEGRKLLNLTAAEIDDHALKLAEDGKNPRTINAAIDAVLRPYAVFCKRHNIPNRLEKKVEKHTLKPKERGILTPVEIGKIIKIDDDPRAKAIVLLGAMCGLRKGEIRGLLQDDIDREGMILHIQHNYVHDSEGLKAPKCGSRRSVPLPAVVLESIDEIAKYFPVGCFVIPNTNNIKMPVPQCSIARGFHRILKKIGIPEEERKRRNLVVHGLRHTFVSLNRSSGLPDFIIAQLSGHHDLEMINRYSHTEGLIDFAAARAGIEKAIKEGTTKTG